MNQGDTGSTGSKAIGGNQGDRASEIQGDIQGDTPSPTTLEAAEIIYRCAGFANPYGAAHNLITGRDRQAPFHIKGDIAHAVVRTASGWDNPNASPYWHAQVLLAERVLRDAGLVG